MADETTQQTVPGSQGLHTPISPLSSAEDRIGGGAPSASSSAAPTPPYGPVTTAVPVHDDKSAIKHHSSTGSGVGTMVRVAETRLFNHQLAKNISDRELTPYILSKGETIDWRYRALDLVQCYSEVSAPSFCILGRVRRTHAWFGPHLVCSAAQYSYGLAGIQYCLGCLGS